MNQFTAAMMPTSLQGSIEGRGTPIAPGPRGAAAYTSSTGQAEEPGPVLSGIGPDDWRWSA